MDKIRRLTGWLLLGLVAGGIWSIGASQGDASITLGTAPVPPVAVENPGRTVTIFWDVDPNATPERVHYRLTNPLATVVEDADYPGSSGLVVTRDWVVPHGASGGSYRVRIEFHSVEHGLEATAEVVFWVADPPAAVERATWGRIKALLGL